MGKEPIHTRLFEEAESPIPVIPADTAWEAMRKELEKQTLQKPDFQLFVKRNLLLLAGIIVVIIAGFGIWESVSKEKAPGNDPDAPGTAATHIPAGSRRGTTNGKIIRENDPLSVQPDDPGASSLENSPIPGSNNIQHKDGNNNGGNDVLNPEAVAGNYEKVDRKEVNIITDQRTGKGNNEQEMFPVWKATAGRKDRDNTAGNRNPEQQQPAVNNNDRRSILSSGDDKQLSTGAATGMPENEYTSPVYTMILPPVDMTPGADIPGRMAALSAETGGHLQDNSLRRRKISWSAGLQWQVPVPIGTSDQYFTGPDGGSQPYRFILPAAFVTVRKNRHLLTLDFQPYIQEITEDGLYDTYNDTMLLERKSLQKAFGYGMGLYYQYDISRNWRLGIGGQVNRWQKGLVRKEVDSLGISYEKVYSIQTGDSDWEKVARMQFKAGIEAWFNRPRWATGLRATLPLGKPFPDIQEGPTIPVQLALLLRWKLLPEKK